MWYVFFAISLSVFFFFRRCVYFVVVVLDHWSGSVCLIHTVHPYLRTPYICGKYIFIQIEFYRYVIRFGKQTQHDTDCGINQAYCIYYVEICICIFICMCSVQRTWVSTIEWCVCVCVCEATIVNKLWSVHHILSEWRSVCALHTVYACLCVQNKWNHFIWNSISQNSNANCMCVYVCVCQMERERGVYKINGNRCDTHERVCGVNSSKN